MSSELVASRLVGTMHRLFGRSGRIMIKEPMLHPTPFLFLYDHYHEQKKHTSGDTVPIDTPTHSAVISNQVAFHSFEPVVVDSYSVAIEQQVQDRVHDVILALDKAGLDWQTSEGLLKLENSIHEKGTAFDKVIEEQNLYGARTTVTAIEPTVFYCMLGTKDRYMGAMRDGELYSEELKESWKNNGLSIEFPKGEGHHVTPEVMYGSTLGKQVAHYHETLYSRYQQIHRERYGGVMMGVLFFAMGIYTLYWQWQWISYRELERQRFKLSLRILDPDTPLSEGRQNLLAKHKEFLTTYYEDDEEEEEDDDEEEEEEEEEADE